MSDGLHVVCPHCQRVNRVPAERLGSGAKCGVCKQPLFDGKPAEVDAAGLQTQITRSDLPVVVDFWAPWCAPCRMMAPAFEQAAQQLEPQVRLAKLNTAAHPQGAAPFGIRGIPTLILFKRGAEAARVSGAMDARSLINWIRQQL